MTEKKESRDEKLIEELYEKLWWYTHEATDEEFDEKEVDAITRLLDILEPVHDDQAYASGADAALQRFWERYGEEEEAAGTDAASESSAATVSAGVYGDEENAPVSAQRAGKAAGGIMARAAEEDRAASATDLSDKAPAGKSAGKPNGHRRGGWKGVIIRIGIGLAACVVLLVTVNVGCYAVKKKSFFEIVREGVGRTEITVTGNADDFETTVDGSVECSSWDEVMKIVGEGILTPQYIPDGYELESLSVQNVKYEKMVVARYTEKKKGFLLRFRINLYTEEFRKYIMQYEQDWNTLCEKEDASDVQYTDNGSEIEAFFSTGNCVYYISNNESIEVLEKVVQNMTD